MVQPEVAYAQALLELYDSYEPADEAGRLLGEYADAIAGSQQLFQFLKSPAIPAKVKKETLLKLSDRPLPERMVHFLYLLVDRERIVQLPEIHRHYRQLFAKRFDIAVIRVQSAYALPDEVLENIRQVYMEKNGARQAWLETTIDPKLIGGVRILVGDMLYDSSLFGKLEGLRREIGKIKVV